MTCACVRIAPAPPLIHSIIQEGAGIDGVHRRDSSRSKKEGQLNPHLQAMTDEELLEWWAHRAESREQTSQKRIQSSKTANTNTSLNVLQNSTIEVKG